MAALPGGNGLPAPVSLKWPDMHPGPGPRGGRSRRRGCPSDAVAGRFGPLADSYIKVGNSILMSFSTVRRALGLSLIALLVSSCGGGRGSPAPPPAGGITVTPGDNQVVISWTPDPGVEYWLFYAPATSISKTNLSSVAGLKGIVNVTSPYILSGLANGQIYSYTMDGRYDGGPGGAGTPSVSATPRLAGGTWTAGSTMAADMHGVAWGAASNATNYYLAAGAGGALYQSTDGVTTSGLNWTQIPTATSGVTANLNAAVYTLSKFVVVGDGGAIYSTADLTAAWTAGNFATTQNLNAVASNGSRLVAVGNAGAIVYSGDGVTWAAAASVPTSNNLYGVSYLSTGIWMAVGAGGTLLTSSDGSNWTAGASGTTVDLKAAAYRSSVTTTITIPTTTTTTTPAAYVVVGSGGLVLTSTDAATWTAQTLGTANLLAVTPVLSQFLAVGAGGVAYNSVNGTNWTALTTGSGSNLYGMTNAQGQFTAVGAGGVSVFTR